MDAPVLLAFTAGLVATLNPCGFAMLPAYLSFFVGLGDAGAGAATASGRAAHLTRALVVGGVVSAAFLVVFGVVGAVLTAGVTAALLVTWLPWVAMAVGVAIAGLGVAVVRGFQLQVSLPHPEAGTRGRGLGHVFAFGVSYALASLSCTLPVFLAVVAGTLTRANVSSGLAAFLAYGLGMSTVLLSLVVALALARHGVVRRLRRAVRLAQRISGGLLIVAGAYVVYFWGYTLATGGTGRAGSAPITFVDRISARVRPRAGGGRLRGEAVRVPGARRPHQGGDPSPGATGGNASPAGRDTRHRPPHAPGRRRRGARRADPEGVRPPRLPRPGRRGGLRAPGHPRGRLGPPLVRPNQDARRPRGGAAPQARQPRVDPDGTGRGLPAEPRAVTRRLLAGYLTITAIVLVLLEVPLGVVFARLERATLIAGVRHDAVRIATFAGEPLTAGEDRLLETAAGDYGRATDGRVVVVVDRPGRPCGFPPRPTASGSTSMSSTRARVWTPTPGRASSAGCGPPRRGPSRWGERASGSPSPTAW